MKIRFHDITVCITRGLIRLTEQGRVLEKRMQPGHAVCSRSSSPASDKPTPVLRRVGQDRSTRGERRQMA